MKRTAKEIFSKIITVEEEVWGPGNMEWSERNRRAQELVGEEMFKGLNSDDESNSSRITGSPQ